MKKSLFFALILAFVVSVMALTASAKVAITYDIEDGNVAGTYQIVATITDTEGDFRGYANVFTVDSSVIVPSTKKGVAVDFSNGTSTSKAPITLYGYYVEDDDATYSPSYAEGPEWTVDGTKITLNAKTLFTQPEDYPADGYVAFSMHFVYAEGKSEEDITDDTFVINQVIYSNGAAYYYGCEDDGYQTNLNVVNSVVPEAPVVSEDWVAGAGYLIDGAASATTKTETSATKVSVSHGGYYTGADNWGGVASKEKVTVDGLEIEVAYTSVPESSDCWMYIGVLENPSIFVASKTATYNKGYVNLIRYSQDKMVAYGTDTWAETGVYGKGTGFFAIKAGDVLRVCFAKNAQGTYDVTYIKNNTELLEGPKGLALDDTAHVVVSASAKDSAKDAFAYTVDTAPAALKVAEIPVNAGDVVYKAGSKIAPVEIAEDGTYNIVITEANCGTYIVNTGYTAQVGYVVAKTGVTEFALENGVLGSNNVAMREVAPQGIRFFGTVTQDVREFATLVEYGFIMTAESAYNALGNNYVLDMDLVSKNKAKKGVAYNGADLDKYYEIDVEKVVFAGVLHGIPADAAGVQTVIASRPYYKLSDGTVVYGEVTKASLYQIAKKIYGDDNYAASQAYAKTIIELVEGVQEEPEEPTEPENEIIIDVGSLYR